MNARPGRAQPLRALTGLTVLLCSVMVTTAAGMRGSPANAGGRVSAESGPWPWIVAAALAAAVGAAFVVTRRRREQAR